MCPHRMTEPNPQGQATEVRRLPIPESVDPMAVLGTSDSVLRALQAGFPDLAITSIGREIAITGPAGEADLAATLVGELLSSALAGDVLDAEAVTHAVSLLTQASGAGASIAPDVLSVRGRSIRPKSPGQSAYVDAMRRSSVVFGIGPAGTGKTYLAMAEAVSRLLSGEVRRIVLTRPAVEAGENLGFLPGSLTEKIDPYLRPLYDALNDMLDSDALPRFLEAGTIEVAPLAYMRGRTLNDSFIILDEAQNTTSSQMKMFLTRLGFNSHMVVTGDVSQIDLGGGVSSGLTIVQDILGGVDGVEFCYLTSADVIRHELVGRIIDAYSRYDEREALVQAVKTRPAQNKRRGRR